MAEIREVGGRIRLISDGDVSAALFAVSESTGVDLLWGIGGTPEGVISAAAIKCLGGQMLGRLWPRDDEERQAAIDAGYDLDEVLDADRLVSGDDVFFAATGVTDGELLQGVRYPRSGPGIDGVARHPLALGNRSHRAGSPRPGEAARDHRRPLRLSAVRVSTVTVRTFDPLRFGYVPSVERGNHSPSSLRAVVGATGYIGRKLTLELLERGENRFAPSPALPRRRRI